MTDLPDLEAIPGAVWSALEGAVPDRRHPYHLGVVATVTGAAPAVRTVVLRHADTATRELRFHTDARSVKARQLRDNPAIAWLFYDPVAKCQVRASGMARLHCGDAFAQVIWDAMQPMSRECYRMETASGAALDAPFAAPRPAFNRDVVPETEAAAAFNRMLIVRTTIDTIEFLQLRAEGHARAIARWNGTAWEAHWAAP